MNETPAEKYQEAHELNYDSREPLYGCNEIINA